MQNPNHSTIISLLTPSRYDDERERERERRAVEMDDRGATARRQELRRQDKEEARQKQVIGVLSALLSRVV